MDFEEIDELVRRQFRLDTNCSEDMENEYRVMINPSVKAAGSRFYGELSPFFRAIIYFGDMYLCCDERIIEVIREKYSKYAPEWFCKFSNLNELNTLLGGYGYSILDTHIYFLPGQDFYDYEFETDYELVYLEPEAILELKGDKRFHNAFAYIEDAPDMIGLAAMHNDKMIGCAGASADGKYMWQIGVDVIEDYRGQGLSCALTHTLAAKIMDKGIVPYYGTCESHSISRRCAIGSGFAPAFCEVYVKKILP